MLSVLALLLFQGNFFSLRMNTGGSFPRPLKPEEEQVLLERAGTGDMVARNKLIEHNLRLVAHIVKNRKSERLIFTPETKYAGVETARATEVARAVFCVIGWYGRSAALFDELQQNAGVVPDKADGIPTHGEGAGGNVHLLFPQIR